MQKNYGLDIKAKDAAKKFGKKFACGASVVENNAIEIQGDVGDDIIPDINDVEDDGEAQDETQEERNKRKKEFKMLA